MNNISINTDIISGFGRTAPVLRKIADAGFDSIHWCHHWCTDHIYTDREIRKIKSDLKKYSLVLTDLHGSAGRKKNWYSTDESRRLAGVELVKNRLEMTAELGGRAAVMHPPSGKNSRETEQLKKSIDELSSFARSAGIKIAIENMVSPESCDVIEAMFHEFDPDFLGFCWDAGHSNMTPDGIGRVEPFMDRLTVLHLHDNNGKSDQHKLPFTGTIDWNRAAGLIAGSSYNGPFTMEMMIWNTGYKRRTSFLREAERTAGRLNKLVEEKRGTAVCAGSESRTGRS